MAKGNRTGKGYYKPRGKEKLSSICIGLRLPESIDRKLREEYRLEKTDLGDFIREAVREKVERLERENSSA